MLYLGYTFFWSKIKLTWAHPMKNLNHIASMLFWWIFQDIWIFGFVKMPRYKQIYVFSEAVHANLSSSYISFWHSHTLPSNFETLHIVAPGWHNLWGYRWTLEILKSYWWARNHRFSWQKCRNCAFSRQKCVFFIIFIYMYIFLNMF